MRRFQPRISLGSRARVQARQANLVDHNERHKLKEQQFAGKTIPYLPIFVRAEGKHIALAEIMIEPNQNAKEVHKRLKGLLGPTITRSIFPSIRRSMFRRSRLGLVKNDGRPTADGKDGSLRDVRVCRKVRTLRRRRSRQDSRAG